ncbi:hypothetical protein [Sinanaerobacter sp. ZZT-01]|uniref:hypothetical protein n=1 Tax=Sinanaerobacter sp. ZZT-01 TaxID=3111540 RepID=UPI002D76CA87|nr:hypothetical protein [Sinanaerobacter sp. ZZT-01]WRR92152.1 hypothetical protein U5921_08705 [Sinanaerobacter sp. ZZT-01]
MVKKDFRLKAAKIFLLLLIIFLFCPGSKNSLPHIYAEEDLNGNGIKEEYFLSNHTLSVKEADKEIWKTPQNYYVDSFSLGDINHDGNMNLVISLWKKGSFGELKPFWHTEKDEDYKNHLFVYQMQDSTFKSVWCSSNLDRPILFFEIKDQDEDGLNELIVEEGVYKKMIGNYYTPNTNGTTRTAVWKWDEWGFSLQRILK